MYTVARDSRDPVVTTFHSLAGGMAANFNLQVFWVYSVANTWSACFNRSAFDTYSLIRKPGEGMCTFHLLQPIYVPTHPEEDCLATSVGIPSPCLHHHSAHGLTLEVDAQVSSWAVTLEVVSLMYLVNHDV